MKFISKLKSIDIKIWAILIMAAILLYIGPIHLLLVILITAIVAGFMMIIGG